MSERDAALDATRAVLSTAQAAGVFPAAVAEVGDSRHPLWREAYGSLTQHEPVTPADAATTFDLASLTKPIVVTSLALEHVAGGRLSLDEPVAARIAEWRGADREGVTVRDLLEHTSGLPARLMDAPPEERRAFAHEIAVGALEYVPRTTSLYSDLGFILLGLMLEDIGGWPLDHQFAALVGRLSSAAGPDLADLTFGVAIERRDNTAPTLPLPEDLRRGRMLVGEVHDNYAAALGGVAGHAGLFGGAAAVGAFARLVLRGATGDANAPSPFHPALIALATRKSGVAGSSRALGWDTMLPTSSCGARMSAAAFGHVGFTGTSLWIDPTRDRYFVLLSNRVAGSATTGDMLAVRRAFHDAAALI
jgi:CubicO group peptidase (beta-lactamase class C family)